MGSSDTASGTTPDRPHGSHAAYIWSTIDLGTVCLPRVRRGVGIVDQGLPPRRAYCIPGGRPPRRLPRVERDRARWRKTV